MINRSIHRKRWGICINAWRCVLIGLDLKSLKKSERGKEEGGKGAVPGDHTLLADCALVSIRSTKCASCDEPCRPLLSNFLVKTLHSLRKNGKKGKGKSTYSKEKQKCTAVSKGDKNGNDFIRLQVDHVDEVTTFGGG